MDDIEKQNLVNMVVKETTKALKDDDDPTPEIFNVNDTQAMFDYVQTLGCNFDCELYYNIPSGASSTDHGVRSSLGVLELY